ncbi:Prolyl oligopeptidase family [Shewanella morhuae]|nr:Prolyl oligopeptidase family [Shewanella morhuae]
MSPFNYANQIKSPLLLIHGEMDQNSGTFPMQAERMFDAIKGLGGTARLVILPFESHSYSAKESLNHMLWEQSHFLKAHMLATH